ISHISGDRLAHLSVHANPSLHIERGVKARVDAAIGGNRRRVGDNVAVSVDSVVVNGPHDIGRAGTLIESCGSDKPVIKPAITRPNHGFRVAAFVSWAPRQRDPWRPVAVVADPVLAF